MDGYWGPVTASKDWCEQNYVYSLWVAEWWSTLSCAALCGAALLGLWWTRNGERRFTVAYALLFVVGLGSVAFHASLLRETQLLDQLPMWFLVCWLTWVIVDIEPLRPTSRTFRVGLAALAAGVPALYVGTEGKVQFLVFHLTFASLEVFCLARLGWLALRSHVPGALRRYLGALAIYLGAVAVWAIDLAYCDFMTHEVRAYGLPRIEWHAVWHVGIATGFFLMVQLLYDLRGERRPQYKLGNRPPGDR